MAAHRYPSSPPKPSFLEVRVYLVAHLSDDGVEEPLACPAREGEIHPAQGNIGSGPCNDAESSLVRWIVVTGRRYKAQVRSELHLGVRRLLTRWTRALLRLVACERACFERAGNELKISTASQSTQRRATPCMQGVWSLGSHERQHVCPADHYRDCGLSLIPQPI